MDFTVVDSATPRKENDLLEDNMTDQEFEEAAELLDIDVPGPCRAGVSANLALLASHARLLDRWVETDEES